jgi:hypothetical protein
MCKTCGEVVAAKDIYDGRCATCVKNNVLPHEEKNEKSYQEELILNFEQRHKLGEKSDKKTNSHEEIQTEEQPKTQKKEYVTKENSPKPNRGIFISLILIVMGFIVYEGYSKFFTKKWYEDCNSKKMREGYPDEFKTSIEHSYKSITVNRVEIISKPQTIQEDPLKCSVRLSYRLDLPNLRYQIGTVTLIRTSTGEDLEHDLIHENVSLVDDVSEVHSLLKLY